MPSFTTIRSHTLTLLDGIDFQGFQPQLCPEFTENEMDVLGAVQKWGTKCISRQTG